jgi:hypothetical protein
MARYTRQSDPRDYNSIGFEAVANGRVEEVSMNYQPGSERYEVREKVQGGRVRRTRPRSRGRAYDAFNQYLDIPADTADKRDYRARNSDLAKKAPIAPSWKAWQRDKGKWDWPGIDTPR